MPKVTLRRIQEVTRQSEVFRLPIVDGLNLPAVEAEHRRTRQAQKYGRVRRDDELCDALGREVMHNPKEGELTLRRKRRLRLIEEVEPIFESMLEECEERFPV